MNPKHFCLLLAGDPMQLPPPDNSQMRLHIEWVSSLYSAHHQTMRIVRLASAIPPRFSRARAALPPDVAPDVDVREIDPLAWATLIDDVWNARPTDPGVARAGVAGQREFWIESDDGHLEHGRTLSGPLSACRARAPVGASVDGHRRVGRCSSGWTWR